VLGDGFSADMDATKIGLKGSPTFVRKSFTPPVAAGGEILKAETPEEVVKMLVGKLTETHVI
ncbi:MAG: electron transfer flavoprotein subunit beta, partial [Firmicutes bacterium]|nr:electron transfer flavoprotein subunit beta [Bacillota bacterium]